MRSSGVLLWVVIAYFSFLIPSGRGADKRNCYILLSKKNIIELSFEDDAKKLTQFRKKILDRSAFFFADYSISADKFFKDKARQIRNEDARKNYKNLLSTIGILPHDFKTGRQSSEAANRVRQALLALARAKGYSQFDPLNVEEVAKLLDLDSEKLTLSKYLGSLKGELKKLSQFQEEILNRSNQLFTGYAIRADKFFRGKAKEIKDPEEKTQYQQLLLSIALRPQDFQTGKKSPDAADRVYQALVALAKAKGHSNFNAFNIKEVSELLGVNPAKFTLLKELGSLDGDENLKKFLSFKKNILLRSKELFPGYLSKTKKIFEAQIETISDEEKRQKYKSFLEVIDLNETDISNGARPGKVSAAERVYQALRALSNAKGKPDLDVTDFESVNSLLHE